jgi:PBP1b-binding outer membrane lipoprotein LpoB
MKPLTFKYAPTLALAVMGLMLAGCQQTPAPVVVNTPPPTSSTSEQTKSTSTETKQVETPPAATPDSTSTETKKSEQTTSVEKKKQ